MERRKIAPGDRVRIIKDGHTFQGRLGTVRLIEPNIRAALFVDDLLHVALDSGHSIRIFSVYIKTERSQPMNRKGFTLMELMVVVAITAIAATLAFPVFTDYVGKDRARRASRTIIGALNGARMHALKEGAVTVAAFNAGSISVVEVGGNTIKTWTLPEDTDMVYNDVPGGVVRYAPSGMLESEYIKSLPEGDLYPVQIRTGNGYLQFTVGVSISGISRIR